MRAAILALLLSTPYVLPAAPPGATPAGEPEASCDADCDKAAATCVDACEAKFPNDPAQRVGCKVKCAESRVSCSKACTK